jgi:hypothetical protein
MIGAYKSLARGHIRGQDLPITHLLFADTDDNLPLARLAPDQHISGTFVIRAEECHQTTLARGVEEERLSTQYTNCAKEMSHVF